MKKLAMRELWWAQIKSVIRLEMKKTLFARRGLWIYVLALLPVLLFTAHTIVMSHDRERTRHIASEGEKALTRQVLAAIKPGMSTPEVITLLGKPPRRFHWTESKEPVEADKSEGEVENKRREDKLEAKPIEINHEDYHYSDGLDDLYVDIAEGKVSGVSLHDGYNLAQESTVFAGVFQFFYLRLAIFFGCLGVFMNLFRGEILDKSLHFYFLAPIRREVLMVGKFLAGLLATCLIFVTSELLQIVAFTWAFSPNIRDLYLYQNHGLAHSAAYLGVTALACLGYGTFFLAAGMLFRNPILPAAAILGWEAINPFLPALLKKFSVIYYLKSLCPVDIPAPPGMPPLMQLLISNPDPVSTPVAILSIVLLAVLVLYVSSFQVRRMEINYTTE
jgi:ABC-type transport system involved in multi-copper enzyme maturation permease subunit